ncbi:helix-turn-helix domain-containing protein [Clostridium sp.]|uniref:helix-turn-helix domain-containing protein n=1 Tax=Clostridium sp. TaxID=1506 RepID=UPI0032166527
MKGSILRQLRKKAGLTQAELAQKVDLSDSTIRMIELGNREGTKKNVAKIAEFFDVSVDYLEGRESREESDDKLKKFLELLVKENVIKDTENIPDGIQTIIMYNVKQELERIMKENSDD